MRATAAAPSPAALAVPTPTANAASEAPPEATPYTMTIYNGPRVEQIVWVLENGSWRSYKVFPACSSPCGTNAPACGAEAHCVRHPCS